MESDIEKAQRLLGEARDHIERGKEIDSIISLDLAQDSIDHTLAVLESSGELSGSSNSKELRELDNMEVEIAALTASRDYMEHEMEFYKGLYRELYAKMGEGEKPKCPFCGANLWCDKCDPFGVRTHGSVPWRDVLDPPTEEPKKRMGWEIYDEACERERTEEPELTHWQAEDLDDEKQFLEEEPDYSGQNMRVWSEGEHPLREFSHHLEEKDGKVHLKPGPKPLAKGKDPFIGGPLSSEYDPMPGETGEMYRNRTGHTIWEWMKKKEDD